MQMFYLVFMMCRLSVMAVMVVVKMVSLDIQACFAVSKKKKVFRNSRQAPVITKSPNDQLNTISCTLLVVYV